MPAAKRQRTEFDEIFDGLEGVPEVESRQEGNLHLQKHVLLILFNEHKSKKNAITNAKLRVRLNATGLFKLSLKDSRPVRQAVNEMRKRGIPICSLSGVGYWWPESYAEAVPVADELEARAKDILYTKARFIEGAAHFFGRQAKMPFIEEHTEETEFVLP